MLTTFLCLATPLLAPAPATVELFPTDDVWAYPHAAEPDNDPFLRVWGFEGTAVAKSADESESLGYSFLKFDLSGLPTKALKGATLTLTHTPNPPFTLEAAKKSPLEARPTNADFSEKTWGYNDLSKYMPPSSKESLYGTGVPTAIEDEKSFKISIDLTKGPNSFAKALDGARAKGALGIALTTTLSPNEEARSVYKVYSRNGPAELRPVLKLEFED